MNTQEVYKPRSVVIDSVELTNFDGTHSIDLSNMFIDLNIYEDIFQSHITGDITLEDALELIEYFPIIGEESLRIKWHVPTTSIKDYFDSGELMVYKIGNRSASGVKGGKSSIYTLFFVSVEALNNLNNVVSRSFNTKNASDIARIVYNDYIGSDKPFDVEDSEGKLKVVVPGWAPFKTINWLAGTKAMTADQNADFFFFESLNKRSGPRFNFKSLSTLLNADTSFTVEFRPQNISNVKSRDLSTAAYNVDSFSFPKHGDTIDSSINGLYNQTWILHDPLRKKFVISKPTNSSDIEDGQHNKTFSKIQEGKKFPLQYIRMPGGVDSFPASISPTKSLNNDTAAGLEPTSLRKQIPYIASRETSDELECSSLVSEVLHRRSFKIQELNTYKVNFGNIPGTHLIQLGSTINFNKPHLSYDSDLYTKKLGRQDDRFISGKYLVTRMRHNISASSDSSERSYVLAVEGVRNRFNEKISGKKI